MTDRLLYVAATEGTTLDTTAAQNCLAAVVRRLAVEKRAELDRQKANHSDLKRPDFLWHYLLQSFATMGRSSGLEGLINNRSNYRRVTYEAITAIPESKRLAEIKTVCWAAKIRMPDLKADYIHGCYAQVRDMGGPEAAKARLLTQPGREGKIRFLKALRGIGDKYARNIMMDVYHEEFRDSIAVDVRIKAVSESLGVTFGSYAAHEAFYLSVAKLAGINGWELDRILYNFQREIDSRL